MENPSKGYVPSEGASFQKESLPNVMCLTREISLHQRKSPFIRKKSLPKDVILSKEICHPVEISLHKEISIPKEVPSEGFRKR
jgi:hypothetical protein